MRSETCKTQEVKHILTMKQFERVVYLFHIRWEFLLWIVLFEKRGRYQHTDKLFRLAREKLLWSWVCSLRHPLWWQLWQMAQEGPWWLFFFLVACAAFALHLLDQSKACKLPANERRGAKKVKRCCGAATSSLFFSAHWPYLSSGKWQLVRKLRMYRLCVTSKYLPI